LARVEKLMEGSIVNSSFSYNSNFMGNPSNIASNQLSWHGVNTNVLSVFQVFFQELKESNTFDKEAQNNAFESTREQIFNSLNCECRKFISENFGAINQWIITKIEATIYELKIKLLDSFE